MTYEKLYSNQDERNNNNNDNNLESVFSVDALEIGFA